MPVKKYMKLIQHKKYVQDRALELRASILHDACYKNEINKVKVDLFLKYNERLKKLNRKHKFLA